MWEIKIKAAHTRYQQRVARMVLDFYKNLMNLKRGSILMYQTPFPLVALHNLQTTH